MTATHNRRVAFATLGCRLNQYETDALIGDFSRAGYSVVPFEDEADIYIINTCTITGKGEQKSRNLVNRARRHPDATVIVTGCSVETEGEYYNALPGIDLVIPNSTKYGILARLNGYLADAEGGAAVTEDVFGYHTADRTLRTRSMVKIQDGCNSFCSYCIVPYTRGRAVSRPAEAVIQNAKDLLAAGFKELVLTGVNMSTYQDGETGFAALIRSLLAINGEWRLRIASVEPEKLDDSIIDLFEDPKLCRHLHLCLQSGSDTVLQRMNRNYTTAQFLAFTQKLKKRYPDFNITTDLIVGFPGETEEDFAASLTMIREAGFSHVHTFKYSSRKGTRAAAFPDQIPETVKQERSERVRQLAEKLKKQAREALLDTEQTVLIERINKEGMARGYCSGYHPFRFPAHEAVKNSFARVHARALHPESLDIEAEPCPPVPGEA